MAIATEAVPQSELNQILAYLNLRTNSFILLLLSPLVNQLEREK